MKQPLKNKKPIEINTLLIDGNCLLKKSITGAKDKFNSKGIQVGGIYQFIVTLRLLLKTKEWDFVYVFWDGDLSGKLRFDLLPEYKANRDKAYSDMGNDTKDYISKIKSKLYKIVFFWFNNWKVFLNTCFNYKLRNFIS